MMNLLNYVVQHHSKLDSRLIPKDDLELATKINTFFIEKKPLYRKDVLNYFGISKHTFYKLKNANLIKVPEDISNRRNSNKYKEFAHDANS